MVTGEWQLESRPKVTRNFRIESEWQAVNSSSCGVKILMLKNVHSQESELVFDRGSRQQPLNLVFIINSDRKK